MEPLSQQYHRAYLTWCDLENAAKILEDMKSVVFSQMMLKMLKMHNMPVNRAEVQVKASQEWVDYIEKMIAARYDANKARGEIEFIKMRGWEATSNAADNRLQARI